MLGNALGSVLTKAETEKVTAHPPSRGTAAVGILHRDCSWKAEEVPAPTTLARMGGISSVAFPFPHRQR